MRETPQALQAFVWYRDMGPGRSLAAVAQEHAKDMPTLKKWSYTHGWVARASEHDQAIAEKAASADQKARVADAERRLQDRLKVAQGLRHKAANALKLMKDEELAKRPYAVVQMFDHADKTERLDTGQPTDRTEHGVSDQLWERLGDLFDIALGPRSPDDPYSRSR